MGDDPRADRTRPPRPHGADAPPGARPTASQTVPPTAHGPASTGHGDPVRERTEPRTLELLVCPLTKATLDYDEPRQELISRRANLAYPIRCGVPLLTREAARSLDDPH
jgi:hypothetical protein